jgi:protocatechuate 3,4-dioxygenase beta subunit
VRLIAESTLTHTATTGNLSRGMIGQTSTDAQGRYRYDGVPPGRYRLYVEKPGFAFREGLDGLEVEVRPGLPATLDVKMERGAALDGTLVDAAGDPIAGASTVIYAQPVAPDTAGGATQRPSASPTDELGRFRLHSIAPGTYIVRVEVGLSRAADSNWYYPGTDRRELAREFRLTAGQALSLGRFELPPGAEIRRPADPASRLGLSGARGQGAIEGQMLDESGDPAPWIRVALLERRFAAGRFRLFSRSPDGRTYDPSMTRITNDIGGFRFERLQPGEYYLVALTVPFSTGGGFIPAGQGLAGLIPHFYPNAQSEAEAQAIHVRDGETVTMTMSLPGAKTGTVTVRLLDADGRTAPESELTRVAALYRTHFGRVSPALMAQQQSREGLLVFREVPEGEYIVMAGSFVNVSVSGGETTDVSAPVTPSAGAVRGRIVFAGAGPRPSYDQVSVRRHLPGELAAIVPGIAEQPATVDEQGNLTFPRFALPPVVVRVSAPRGWALAHVRLGDLDITDTPIDFSQGMDNLEVVLTSAVGSVTGTVLDAGTPTSAHGVILFAEDRERWTFPSRFIHVAHVDGQGRFEIPGVLPGQYRAVPLPNNTDEGADPEWLEMMWTAAVPVAVSAGQASAIVLAVPR